VRRVSWRRTTPRPNVITSTTQGPDLTATYPTLTLTLPSDVMQMMCVEVEKLEMKNADRREAVLAKT